MNDNLEQPDERINPTRIDDDVTPPAGSGGTAESDPIAGVKISEEQVEEAVEPDDKALDLDGPTPGHA